MHDSRTKKTAKLIDTRGNLRQVQLPIKAAELMLDEPGHVISPAEQLRLTRRVSAMRADDELLAGKIYLLVPVGRVNSKMSEAEMAVAEAACARKKTKSKKKRSGAKVLPAAPEELTEEIQGFEGTVLGANDSGFPGCRLRNLRSWNPVLEPINE